MSVGKLTYKYLFKPTYSIRYHLHHFGFWGWLKMLDGERQMKRAAARLIPISLKGDIMLEVNYLTGEKYWHQTIFCAYTLAKIMDGRVRIKLYSDGTLTENHIGYINQVVSGIEEIPEDYVIQRLDWRLPRDKFPTLRLLRDWHPFFRRLIDIHTTTSSWAIHMDSDMIFWSKPNHILEAFQNKTAVYMKERLENSYFVDDENTLRDKFGILCKRSVNGGIIAYDNDKVDYADLEEKAKLLLKHYPNAGAAQVEQTLMSYLLYQQDASALDEDEYTIFYDEKPNLKRSQIVRHYIFKAKLPYLKSEWKRATL